MIADVGTVVAWVALGALIGPEIVLGLVALYLWLRHLHARRRERQETD